jgi:hypothetical protein
MTQGNASRSRAGGSSLDAKGEVRLCFFRGLSVFGRGTISMSELERRCRMAFASSQLALRFVDYHGSTGNDVLLAEGVPEDDVRRALFQAIPKPCALLGSQVVEAMRRAFRAWPLRPTVLATGGL